MTPTLAIVIISVAVVALAAIGASVWDRVRYGRARDDTAKARQDSSDAVLKLDRANRALADGQATIAALRDKVLALEAQVMAGEGEVRRLRLAVSPADRADAMGSKQ